MLIADSTTVATLIGFGIAIFLWFVMVAATVAIALKKGRTPVGWGLFAMFFSLIALIVIALMPSRSAGSSL